MNRKKNILLTKISHLVLNNNEWLQFTLYRKNIEL